MREDDKRAIVEQTPLQSSTDVSLYSALLTMVSNSAEVGLSTAYLTRVLKVDRRTVMRSFRRLEAAGLVVSTQTAPGRGVRRLLPCIKTWTEPKGGRRWACDLTARQGETAPPTDREPAQTPEAPSQAVIAKARLKSSHHRADAVSIDRQSAKLSGANLE